MNLDHVDNRSVQNGSSQPEILKLRLYLAGKSPNSVRALANLQSICREWLQEGNCELEIIDIVDQPMQALEDKILVTPTLLKLTPTAVRIIGDLSCRDTVLKALNIAKDKS